jgi:ABC-2 type transport system permease protein
VAKTQQAIGAMGSLFTFPQMFLAGIFYPIDILPELIQPIAQLLPLSFVANGLREIAVNGASLLDILPTLVGLVVWAVIALILAIRMFVWKEVAS